MNLKICNFDYNGECLVCDAWPMYCGYDRLIRGGFEFESFDELMSLLDKHLTTEQKIELNKKYGKEN